MRCPISPKTPLPWVTWTPSNKWFPRRTRWNLAVWLSSYVREQTDEQTNWHTHRNISYLSRRRSSNLAVLATAAVKRYLTRVSLCNKGLAACRLLNAVQFLRMSNPAQSPFFVVAAAIYSTIDSPIAHTKLVSSPTELESNVVSDRFMFERLRKSSTSRLDQTRSIFEMLGPFAIASRRTPPVYIAIHCRTPPARRCPQQHRRQQRQQRQRVTDGTAMTPWNGPNKQHNSTREVRFPINVVITWSV